MATPNERTKQQILSVIMEADAKLSEASAVARYAVETVTESQLYDAYLAFVLDAIDSATRLLARARAYTKDIDLEEMPF